MTPERWQLVSRLYHDALARPAGARAEFLRAAAGEDAALERQVLELLAQDSGSFLRPSALDGDRAAPVRTASGIVPSLAMGTRLGRFALRGLLGAGGMGEVYRAHDDELGRDVALKIVPAAFASDPDRLARFEREARLLAALNHANIAAIYGVEHLPPAGSAHGSGVRALVLELVEGKTLAERLTAGALPLDRALAVAMQVADALDAAHEKGIVHRDLKPANITIRADGVAKVLDFGLAKAIDAAGAPQPSAALRGETSAGVILGTPSYMSPEQARGHAVDKRTDIWSFGCVLFEMLCGRPAFAGDTPSDTIAAVLNGEPDLTLLPASTPGAVRRTIERCLVKDVRRRLRDIGDVRFDLEHAVEERAAGARTPGRRGAALLLAGAIGGIGALGAVWLTARAPALSPALERLTFGSGLTTMPAVSPDGQLIAYAADRAGNGDLDIWVQQAGGGAPLRLTTDPADDHFPQFSPDGRQIVFRSERDGGGAWVVPALGGPERLVAPDARTPRFSPDGSQLAYWTGQFRGPASTQNSALFVVPLSGGTPRRLAAGFAVTRDPVWAPDGRSLLFLGRSERARPVAETFDWWWIRLDDEELVKTGMFESGLLQETIAFQGDGSPAAWTPDGVLFTAQANLWSVPVAHTTGRLSGAAHRLTDVTGRVDALAPHPEGSILLAVTQSRRVIERIPLDAERGRTPVTLYADNRDVALRASASADGSLIVFDQGFDTYREIWFRDLRTGRQQMVVRLNVAFPGSPTMSPDGTRVAYRVVQPLEAEDAGTGFVVELSGGVPRPVCERCSVFSFLSDSRRVLASWDSGRVLGTIDVRDGSRAELVRHDEGRLDRPHASPDDRFLAFRHIVADGSQVYLTRLQPDRPSRSSDWQRLDEETGTGRPAGWAPDGSMLYAFLDTDGFRCLWGQRVDGNGRLDGPLAPVRHLHEMRDSGLSTSYSNPISDDGLLYERIVRTGDLWMLRQ